MFIERGMIDIDTLKSGEQYSKLKESHVIFICISDIFNMGLPYYNFENLCNENTEIKLNDGAYKHFFIASNYDKIQNEEQKNFLQLLMKNEQTDELSAKILDKVKSAKQNILIRKDYMEYARQRTYDIEAGMKKGEQKKAIEDAIAFLKEGLSVELIAKCINIPISQVKELALQLEKQKVDA